ncbi:MAG: hypothetical protein PUC88_04280 [Clostridia bacterium]|nr:hypothetical protein [Clostridia bacterium]
MKSFENYTLPIAVIMIFLVTVIIVIAVAKIIKDKAKHGHTNDLEHLTNQKMEELVGLWTGGETYTIRIDENFLSINDNTTDTTIYNGSYSFDTEDDVYNLIITNPEGFGDFEKFTFFENKLTGYLKSGTKDGNIRISFIKEANENIDTI